MTAPTPIEAPEGFTAPQFGIPNPHPHAWYRPDTRRWIIGNTPPFLPCWHAYREQEA